jgi:1,4-dihydroxy-2-naphthoate octaprenyltransferase
MSSLGWLTKTQFYMKKLIGAITLLRIPFSIYLMPIYWFALSNLQGDDIDPYRALYVFAIFHLLVYPGSNGYNSYFDRDTSSIGGLEKPPQVFSTLIYVVLIFDLLAIGCSYLLSPLFSMLVLIYMLVSKAYSNDRIRLKRYPIPGTASVVIFQGAFTYLAIQYGVSNSMDGLQSTYNLSAALVSSLFLLGSYPLTQVYQHVADDAHGDRTLSMLLGIKGTFLFSAILFLIASTVLILGYLSNNQIMNIGIYLGLGLPVLIVFYRWQRKVTADPGNANYANAMLMNKMSSLCLSAAFITMVLLR